MSSATKIYINAGHRLPKASHSEQHALNAYRRQRRAIRDGSIFALEEAIRDSTKKINDFTTSSGLTLIQEAVYCGNIEMVKILLDAGADPNRTDFRGKTAMDIYGTSSPEIAALLRLYGGKKGSEPNVI